MTADDRDKQSLIRSQAGMRLIALLTLLNRIDPATPDASRVTAYLKDSFQPDVLERVSADERAGQLVADRVKEGRTRIIQVIGHDPHHVITLSETERGAYYFMDDLTVDAEYPHRITGFDRIPMVDDTEG